MQNDIDGYTCLKAPTRLASTIERCLSKTLETVFKSLQNFIDRHRHYQMVIKICEDSCKSVDRLKYLSTGLTIQKTTPS